MKNKIKYSLPNLTFLILILLTLQSNAQISFEWAGAISGSNYKSVHSIAIDHNNNTIVTGYFKATVDFDLSTNSYNLTSNGGKDIFVAKYDSNNSLLWAFNIGGTNNDESNSVAVDSEGSIYITGSYANFVDFDLGSDVFSLSISSNVFIAKYNSNGDFVNAFDFGGFGHVGKSICIDNLDNIIVTGILHGVGDFDPSVNIMNLTSTGLDDIFIAKYDSDLNYLWASNFGGDSYLSTSDAGNSITTDNNNNIFCTGVFRNTVDFDLGVGSNLLTSNGDQDAFLLKLDATGNYNWALNVGNGSKDKGISVSSDSNGNVVIAGIFLGTVDFDPSSSTANFSSSVTHYSFIAKYDALGNYLWTLLMPDRFHERDRVIVSDDLDNIYCTGSFKESIDFDSSSESEILNSNNDSMDIYIAKYNNAGEYIWAYNLGSSFVSTYEIHEIGNAISIDNNNDVILAGTFDETVDFDIDISTYDLTSIGQNFYADAFIAKYTQLDINLGIENFDNLINVLWPNPTSEYVNITLNSNNEPLEVSIYNRNGKLLIHKDAKLYDTTFTVELPSISGVFFIKLQSSTETYTFKVIKK